MKIFINLLLITLIFSGCDILQSQEEKDKLVVEQKAKLEKQIQESKEIQLKKLSAQTQKELAVLESKKELAMIEKAKELEKIRMQAEVEKQKIIYEQDKQKALFEQEVLKTEQQNNMELKRYIMIILGLFLLICSFFVFYYFKKKREDKLQAYNDNLQKYFNHKESEARVKIANKMLDAISSGNLTKEQENQLISAFSGQSKNENYQKQLSSIKEDDEYIEIDEIKEK